MTNMGLWNIKFKENRRFSFNLSLKETYGFPLTLPFATHRKKGGVFNVETTIDG